MKKRYTLEQKKWDSPADHAMPEHSRVPASFTVGRVRIAPATVLAPMAGVTDTVFRRFIKNASVFATAPTPSQNPLSFRSAAEESASLSSQVETQTTNQQSGCGLIMTEFTSADGLARTRESKRKRYLTYYDDEHPISAQLFGSNPATLADSARIVQDCGFDLVDLNLGCPAKRVVRCNGGSGLLRDLSLIERIFRAIRAAVSIPFTVKFRMGWNDAEIVCVDLARLAQEVRPQRRRPPRPHPRGRLHRPGALAVHRRRERRRAHPRHRQRRHPHPRGRRRHGRTPPAATPS